MIDVSLEDRIGKALIKVGYRNRNLGRPAFVPPEWDGQKMIDWIQRHFFIPELIGHENPAMPLAPYQQAVLREACRTDADGKFIYDLILWSDIKKSIKSSIAAAVTLFRALHAPFFSAKIVANDLKQANSRVFGYILRAVQLNPELSELAKVRNYLITFENYSAIEAIPVDPSGEAGGTDDFLEFTELHAATSKKHQQMWTEMTLSPTKRGFSQRWVDTYAGYSGEAPILEPLYYEAVKEGKRLDLGIPGLDVFAKGGMLALWNDTPRLPWQTPDYYESEARTLLPNEFLRVHRNKWVSSTDIFVPKPWWESCKCELPPEDKYQEIVVAIDAAVSGDCFGILGMSRHGDKVAPRFIYKWEPPEGGKIEYDNPDDPYDQAYPAGVLRRLADIRNVIAFTYDPYQLHHLCTTLENELIGYFLPFNQGTHRLKADKQLHDVIRDRRFMHDGNTDLTEHVLNANAAIEGEKLRIVKRSPRLKIDLCVCASMATEVAYDLLPE